MGNKGGARALPPWSATGAQQVLLGNPTSSTPQTQREGGDIANDASAEAVSFASLEGLHLMGVTTLEFSPYVQGIQGYGSPTYGLDQVAGDTKSDFDLSSRASPTRYTPLPKCCK